MQLESESMNDRQASRGARYWLTGLVAVIAIILALAVYFVFPREDLAARVMAEVPPGTPRVQAVTWLQKQWSFPPTYFDDVAVHTIDGRSIAECAGVSDDDCGGMIYFATRPHASMARQVGFYTHEREAYLLLDKDDRVMAYYFKPDGAGTQVHQRTNKAK
jgi:hypothetical protein